MTKNRRLRAMAWAAFAVCCVEMVAQAESFTGKVVRVIDGDTITVVHDGQAVRVRLSGIDCPEKRQAFGYRAKRITSDLAFGQLVTVYAHGHDRDGRTLADVVLSDGNRSLNQELVRMGAVWWLRRYAPHDKVLADLEAEARAAKRGLWADPHPVPPWEYRHGMAR